MEVGQLWVKLGLDKSNYTAGTNEAKSEATGFSGFLKNAFQMTVGMGMFDALKTGLKAAWDTSIGFNSEMEQSQAAFTTLLGNAGKAKVMLSDLSAYAASTPFELTDLTKSSQTLLSFGIDSKNVMSDLKMLGDVSMGNKEKFSALTLAFAQIQSSGKLMGQDLLQLINAGFNPLQIISKQTGESMAVLKDKMSKGAISADMVTKAFKSATEKGGLFYGAMDKQSKTFDGQMSTLSDNVRSTLGDVLKSEFENLSNVIMPKAINMVSRFGNAFKSGGLGSAFKTILPAGLVDGLSAVGKGIQGAFGWIEQHGPLVKTILAGITAGFVSYKIAVIASIAQQEICNALEAIRIIRLGQSAVMLELETGMTGSCTVATKLLNLAMMSGPWGIVALVIAALVGAIIYLWNTNEGFRKAIIGAWNSIKSFFVELWSWISSFFKKWGTVILAFIAPFIGIPILIFQHWGQITKFFSNLFSDIGKGFTNFIHSAEKWGTDLIDGLINGIKKKISDVGNAVKGVADKIKSFLHFSVPDEGPLRDYETWMPDMIEGMKKGVDDHKGNLISTIKNLAGGMALSVKGSFSSENLAAVTSGNGYNTANIVIELDGKVLARILGQKLVDMIRLKTGVKI